MSDHDTKHPHPGRSPHTNAHGDTLAARMRGALRAMLRVDQPIAPAVARVVNSTAARRSSRGATTLALGLVFGAVGVVGSAEAIADRGADRGADRSANRGTDRGGARLEQIPVGYRVEPTVQTAMIAVDGLFGGSEGGLAGPGCPPNLASHTAADFGPGSYILQAGFAEQEIAAASYTLPAAAFPIKLELAEFLVGTGAATQPTTTQWSFMVWEGKPSNTNPPIIVFSSQDGLVPAITTSAPNQGVKIEVFVDPTDPEQIIIFPNADNAFTIGLRIDQHNAQTQNPCFFGPPQCCNVFPATDTNGLQHPTQNWLFAINCGPFGCPAGWSSFSQLGLCTPSGDWVMRATWSSLECEPVINGACCIGGSCSLLSDVNCAAAGGTFLGANTACIPGACQVQNVACCFAGTFGCVNLALADCQAAGGAPGPAGSVCATYVCFPIGACCLPNGGCEAGLSPAECMALGGAFQGNGTTCATPCPEPTGACCFGSGFCLLLTAGDCAAAGATWAGAGTNCSDGNGNGQADDCEPQAPPCPADLNGDGVVDGADLGVLLNAWGSTDAAADLSGDGVVDGADLGILLNAWGGCP